jgi:hypothetical protein
MTLSIELLGDQLEKNRKQPGTATNGKNAKGER